MENAFERLSGCFTTVRYSFASPARGRLDSHVPMNITSLTLSSLACTTLAWAGSTVASAADVDARALAAGCLGCHHPVANTPLPVLFGQPREALAGKFRALRDGTQPGTVMPQLAKGYTDAQIDALAGYFATQAAPR